MDEKGTNRVSLNVRADGSPELKLNDDEGVHRAELSVGAAGTPTLEMRDERSTAGSRLRCEGLLLQNQESSPRCSLIVRPDGSPGLGMLDANGKTRVLLRVNTEGEPGLGVFDENGKVRAILGAHHMFGTDGAKSAYPESTVTLFAPDGKVSWGSPPTK